MYVISIGFQNKPALNDEVKRNLSLIAKTIAAKMLAASNPVSTPEQQRKSLDDLLSQINSSPSSSSAGEYDLGK